MQRPRRIATWGAVAAAVAATVFAAAIVLQRAPAPRQVTPPPRVVTPIAVPRPAAWESRVADALKKGRIARPAIFGSVRVEPEMLRGEGAATHTALAPASVVLTTTQPAFRWPSNGEPAVVSIYDGATLVAKSGAVTSPPWIPEKPLARNRIYAWQVEFVKKARLLPEPPDPPARFRIVGENAWREIEAARQARPEDHLLLGILEARAGLKQEALDDFARSQDPRARALATSVRGW
jgi:hypothetical protein